MSWWPLTLLLVPKLPETDASSFHVLPFPAESSQLADFGRAFLCSKSSWSFPTYPGGKEPALFSSMSPHLASRDGHACAFVRSLTGAWPTGRQWLPSRAQPVPFHTDTRRPSARRPPPQQRPAPRSARPDHLPAPSGFASPTLVALLTCPQARKPAPWPPPGPLSLDSDSHVQQALGPLHSF